MREFVSYGPRMRRVAGVTTLWTGCQYDPEEFRGLLMQHLGQMNAHFVESVRWLGRKGYNDVRGRILSGPFVLYEFRGVYDYHQHSVARRAWSIYRHVCEHEGVDWRVYNPSPDLWVTDDQRERQLYERIVVSLD
jgi:hypothetical protein